MKRWIRVSLVLLFLSSVRVIPCTRTAEASILPSSPQRAAAPEAKIATDLVPTSTALELVAWLNGIETWILSLDVGTQVLKNTEDTPDSIFINGNFARLLASIHRITGRETGLREVLRWCDSFYVHQRLAPTSKTEEGGFWVDLSRNPKGNIYFGDGGTAAAALAVTRLAWYYRNVDPAPKIKNAVLKYCLFLLDSGKSASYGIKKLVRTTGFAGLTVAEIFQPGCTY